MWRFAPAHSMWGSILSSEAPTWYFSTTTCCVLYMLCYLLRAPRYLLLTTYYLLTTFATFFIGDYILSADVLEPSVDVPGLNAVGYALTI